MESSLHEDIDQILESGDLSITYDALLDSIAKSEGLQSSSVPKVTYTPLYRHPLDVSEKRFAHEENLRKILSSKVAYQGITAVAKGDAWTLESVYMRHGMACLCDRHGTTPLHLAVQMNNLDCVMVLANINVDLNIPNLLGYTPLYVAKLNGYDDIERFLVERKASLKPSTVTVHPTTTVLEVIPERQSSNSQTTSKGAGSQYKEYYRVNYAKQYY